MLCKYKNIFGKPGEGIHKYRLFDVAIADVLFVILIAYIIYLFNKKRNFLLILFIIFACGVIAHKIFCVRTTINKLIFPTDDEKKFIVL